MATGKLQTETSADALYDEITRIVPSGVGPRVGDARANYLAGVRAARERAADLAVPVVCALERRASALARAEAAMRAIATHGIRVRYVEDGGAALWAAGRRVEGGERRTVTIFPTAADAVLWLLEDDELAALGLDVDAERAAKAAVSGRFAAAIGLDE